MQQQSTFPTLSVQTTEAAMLARDLSIIVNAIGIPVIEIEQCDPRVRRLEGIMVCKYREVQQTEEELMSGQEQGNQSSKYPYKIEGGTLEFVQNPYARKPIGTGRVAFLIDDQEEVPRGAMSGSPRGWNREFLASHMVAEEDEFKKNPNKAVRYWYIVDDNIRREIAARAAAIRANVKRKQAENEQNIKDLSEGKQPTFAQEVDNSDALTDPGIGKPEGTDIQAPATQIVEAPSVSASSPMEVERVKTPQEALEEKIAKLSEGLSAANDRITSMQAENMALRAENEKLKKAAENAACAPKGRRGRQKITRAAGGFGG